MMGDQATLARSDRVYWGQMVSAQARYLRAVEAGADAEERAELRAGVLFADATCGRRSRSRCGIAIGRPRRAAR